MKTSHRLLFAGPIVLSALAFVSIALALGLFEEVRPDATFYLAIGKALAQGKGYIDPSGFWPEQPTIGRMPLWPAVISLGITLMPWLDPNFLLRCLNLIIHVLCVVLMMRIVFKQSSSPRYAALAGAFLAINPGLLYYGYAGLSENLYVLIGIIALNLSIGATKRAQYAGAFVLGLGALVKSNTVMIGPAFFFFYLFYARRQRWGYQFAWVWAVLFLSSPSLWVVRNYLVSGHFPVLSSIRGETFYGANNHRAATDLEKWGYWVFPNEIPGEPVKRDIVSTMRGEKEIDDYYFKKGVTFVMENPRQLPRLILGKLIREYVPIPWDPSPMALVGSAYRGLLLSLLVMYLRTAVREMSDVTGGVILAMLATNLVTVIVFYGSARLALTVEPLLIPWAIPYFYGKRQYVSD